MLIKSAAQALAEAKAALGIGSASIMLSGAIIVPYKAGPTPTPNSVFSDFTPCNYSGSTSPTVAFGGPLVENDGSASVVGSLNIFEGTATTTTNNVQGVLILSGDDSLTLVGADKFATPIPISGPGIGFAYVPTFNFGGPSPNTESVIIQ